MGIIQSFRSGAITRIVLEYCQIAPYDLKATYDFAKQRQPQTMATKAFTLGLSAKKKKNAPLKFISENATYANKK